MRAARCTRTAGRKEAGSRLRPANATLRWSTRSPLSDGTAPEAITVPDAIDWPRTTVTPVSRP